MAHPPPPLRVLFRFEWARVRFLSCDDPVWPTTATTATLPPVRCPPAFSFPRDLAARRRGCRLSSGTWEAALASLMNSGAVKATSCDETTRCVCVAVKLNHSVSEATPRKFMPYLVETACGLLEVNLTIRVQFKCTPMLTENMALPLAPAEPRAS